MGFRLFKRVKLFPGVTLNLSKSGVSVSAGVRGAKITVGSKGVRKTVGIPGTGISYTEYQKNDKNPASQSSYLPGSVQAQSTGNPKFGVGSVLIIGLVVLILYVISR